MRSDGGALAVYHRGAKVAELWGGIADDRTGREWQADTPSVIFSCTKGLMSLALAQLVEQGRLDYDAPVARYWPEFAAEGKAAVTVREAIGHRAGLLAPRVDLTMDDFDDWARVAGLLAAQAPVFPPDSGYAYHSLTHGWLTGELVRRITGLPPAPISRSTSPARLQPARGSDCLRRWSQRLRTCRCRRRCRRQAPKPRPRRWPRRISTGPIARRRWAGRCR